MDVAFVRFNDFRPCPARLHEAHHSSHNTPAAILQPLPLQPQYSQGSRKCTNKKTFCGAYGSRNSNNISFQGSREVPGFKRLHKILTLAAT